MKCITEKEKNHYLFVDIIPEVVEQHLSECSFCKQRFVEASEFLGIFNEINSAQPSNKETDKLKNILDLKVKMINFEIDTSLYDHLQYSVMFAETENQKPLNHHKTVAVRISIDGRILIRILENIKTGIKTLYLLAENVDLIKNRKISIGDSSYITNENGKVELGLVPISNELEIILN